MVVMADLGARHLGERPFGAVGLDAGRGAVELAVIDPRQFKPRMQIVRQVGFISHQAGTLGNPIVDEVQCRRLELECGRKRSAVALMDNHDLTLAALVLRQRLE